jgi:hypothetical protein
LYARFRQLDVMLKRLRRFMLQFRCADLRGQRKKQKQHHDNTFPGMAAGEKNSLVRHNLWMPASTPSVLFFH